MTNAIVLFFYVLLPLNDLARIENISLGTRMARCCGIRCEFVNIGGGVTTYS